MDYNLLLDLATDVGYRLAMCGAETFRVEESIQYILRAYGLEGEVFAIPNCLIVSIETAEGKPMTRMRRIGYHGNDLDSVERYNSLCRRICAAVPEPKEAIVWLKQTDDSRKKYKLPVHLLGAFLGAAGFALFFGGDFSDFICSGICGVLVGIIGKMMDSVRANQFFHTIISAFLMALLAYFLGHLGLAGNPDMVTIGALMILVPGLLFTNAMRDIIYGDTNSGINRIVQVFLIAAALALGTAAAWTVAQALWGTPAMVQPYEYGFVIQQIGCFIGCIGFCLLFNIHGPGMLLCTLGGILAWTAYLITVKLGGTDLAGYFVAAVVASVYAEIMARIRKYPAISYLLVSIFPLIPGASIYYTMNYAVRGDMVSFADKGTHTIAIAGLLAAGILMISTSFRLVRVWKLRKSVKK